MKLLDIFTFEYWHIGIIKLKKNSSINEWKKQKIIWMKYKYKDRFLADPFLFKEDKDNYYIIAEEYTYYDRKGRIVLLQFNKQSLKLIKRELLINEATHLSFPYYYNKKILPENFRSGKYYSYSIKDNYYIEKQLIADLPIIDPIIHEYNGIKFLFGSFKKTALNELYLFYEENGKWISHPQNPIVQNYNTARMAGHFFYYNGELYRPAQDCQYSYGNCVRIMKIIELSKNTFREEESNEFKSHTKPFNQGMHTFNVENNYIIVDGYCKRFKPFYKCFLALLKRIYKKKIYQNFISEYRMINNE